MVELIPQVDRSWMDQARCPEVDYDLWFPEKGGSTQRARKICIECPVQSECLEYALAIWPVRGMWAGYTERELAKIARARSA